MSHGDLDQASEQADVVRTKEEVTRCWPWTDSKCSILPQIVLTV